MPSYVSQLRYTQGIYNIAALAGSLDGRGHVIWAGEERCFEPEADVPLIRTLTVATVLCENSGRFRADCNCSMFLRQPLTKSPDV